MKTRFKLLRQELGMTQEEFGSKIGVARNTIAQYESGRIVPSNLFLQEKTSSFHQTPTTSKTN